MVAPIAYGAAIGAPMALRGLQTLGSSGGRSFGSAARNIFKPAEDEDSTGMGDMTQDFYEKSQDYARRLAEVPQNPDQEMVGRYTSELTAPIESNFYQQAGNVSSYLARQGLGSSGMNLAAHAGLESNRSALEGQAKNKALDLAIEKQRQSLLDSFSTEAAGLGPSLQKYVADLQAQTQLQALRAQLDAQSQAGWGQLLGTGIGTLGGLYALGVLSDERLKENIVREDEEALPGVRFATWEYVGIPGVRYRGVIAQDLEDKYPELVSEIGNAIKRVNYDAIG